MSKIKVFKFIFSYVAVLLVFNMLSVMVHAEDNYLGTIEYFYHPDCSYCIGQSEVWNKWQEENKDRLKLVKLEKINIQNAAEASKRGYTNQGTPYIQVKNSKGAVIDKAYGDQTKEQLDRFADKILGEDNYIGAIEYFYHPDCSFCKEQTPIWDKWAEENKDKLKTVKPEKINIQNTVEALKHGYINQGTPYIQVKNRKGDVIDEASGVQTNEQLNGFADKILSETIFTVSEKEYYSNQKEQLSDDAPFLEKGKVYVHARSLVKVLGIEDLSFKGEILSVKKGKLSLEFKINSPIIKINGKEEELDFPAVLKNNRTFLCADYFAEIFGYSAYDDGESVIIGSRVIGKMPEFPEPVESDVDNDYYDLNEILIYAGLNSQDFYFEKDNSIVLNNSRKYAKILLKDGSNNIIIEDVKGNFIDNKIKKPLVKKDGKWLVSDTDIIIIAQIGAAVKD